ncbi:MAG: hypothetical protein K2W97_04200 [Chthoniobacterales bacterium]|nr:hypothetical protein [Chthoniobacterales bacterium]
MLSINLQPSLRFIGTLFIAMALFSLSGGHWAVLQSVAWGRMIQSYSSQGSFSSAVEKTFSGKYRCSLCKKIEYAKQQEKKNDFVNEIFKKKEGVLEQLFSFSKIFPTSFHFPRIRKSFYGGPIMRPLLQPPRIA